MAHHTRKLHLLLTCLFLFFSPLTPLTTVTAMVAATVLPVKPSTPLVSFLERLQHTAFESFADGEPSHFDPKTYVDLPLKFSLAVTDDAFQNLPRAANGSIPARELKSFLEGYFEDAGDDLVHVDPEDFVPEPEGFLPKVKNLEVRAWALQVHSLWKNLTRKVSGSVVAEPELHTLLPLPASAVVPGSRFREVYYWDSYWVIRFVYSIMHVLSASLFLFGGEW